MSQKQILEKPESDAIPEYRDKTTNRKVLTVLWRVPLYEPGSGGRVVPKQEPTIASEPKPDLTVESAYAIEFQPHGAPAVSHDGSRVIVGSLNGILHCLDSQTGKRIWRKLTNGPFDADPAIADDVVYAGSGDGMLTALRASDGTTLWETKLNGSVDGKPVLANDRVLVMTDTNSLFCFDAQKGDWRWNYKRDVPIGKFQVKGVANPLVVDKKVFAGFSDGFLAVLALADGSVQSLKNLAGKNERFSDVDTDPVLTEDGALLVGSFTTGVHSLDPTDFSERWHFPVEGPSSFAYGDGMVYFSTSDSKVIALDAKTGKPTWAFNAKKGNLSRPVIAGRWLLVSSAVHSLLVLDRSNGEVVQIFNPGKGASAPPSVAKNGRVYWVSNGEILYCMDLAR